MLLCGLSPCEIHYTATSVDHTKIKKTKKIKNKYLATPNAIERLLIKILISDEAQLYKDVTPSAEKYTNAHSFDYSK